MAIESHNITKTKHFKSEFCLISDLNSIWKKKQTISNLFKEFQEATQWIKKN